MTNNPSPFGLAWLPLAWSQLALFTLALSAVPTVAISAQSQPKPATRAERTNYLETSSYADVIAFVDSLKIMGAPITVQELAKSPLGKSLPFVIASRPKVATVAEARRLNRPIVYVQANIHAGEVEGKEAVQALLREWSFGKRPNVLDSLVVIVVPMYNADGNDKLAPQARNRGAQLGPEMIGERPNGAGLDLNRDYVKAEAPETQGSLRAFNTWDPDVFMDLHTTNGSYHGYALTYSPSLHPAAPLAPYTADTLLVEITKRMKARYNFDIFPYGNFGTGGGRESITATDKSGWWTYEHAPRYGSNYYGTRGRISILSEAYSHDPFSRRVASTRAFVQEILSYVAENRAGIRARIAAGTAASTLREGASTVAIRGRFNAKPSNQPVLVERLDRIADSTVQTEPGVPRGIKRTGVITVQNMPVVDRFESALSRQAPAGWVLDAKWEKAAELLRQHGVAVTPIAKSGRQTLEVFTIDSVAMSGRAFQGHREATVTGRWTLVVRDVPAGSLLIPANTPRGLLSMLLLEPESDDGLLTWNMFDAALVKGQEAPVARLVTKPSAPAR